MLGIADIIADVHATVIDTGLVNVDIRYTRTGIGVVTIEDAVQSIRATDNIAQANPVNFYLFDFMFPTDELILAGSQVLPAVGDIIETLVNNVVDGKQFKVAKFYDNPHYTYRDTSQTFLRVHAQQTRQTA